MRLICVHSICYAHCDSSEPRTPCFGLPVYLLSLHLSGHNQHQLNIKTPYMYYIMCSVTTMNFFCTTHSAIFTRCWKYSRAKNRSVFLWLHGNKTAAKGSNSVTSADEFPREFKYKRCNITLEFP